MYASSVDAGNRGTIAVEGEGAREADEVAMYEGSAPSSAPIPRIYPNLLNAEVR